ncbi:MAG: hypothetical protein R2770_00340 [Acidimicrobiales bacterium]
MRSKVERKLSKNSTRLKKLRADLQTLEAEYGHFVLSPEPGDRRGPAHVERIERRIAEIRADIVRLEAEQDTLLDQL